MEHKIYIYPFSALGNKAMQKAIEELQQRLMNERQEYVTLTEVMSFLDKKEKEDREDFYFVNGKFACKLSELFDIL